MAKKLVTVVKLQIAAGKANPAPPVGPALGQHGLDIQGFCKDFNARTAPMGDTVVPVEISVFDDRTYTYITKTAPAAVLILKALNLQKGSGEPNKNKVGVLKKAQVREIAETKMPDLNCHDVDAAMKTVEGTARSMGVTVEG